MVDIIEKSPPKAWAEDIDYRVVRIVEFVPKTPELMYAEVWLTDDDYLGLGIERYDRVAEKVGVRTKTTRFVAGFEPCINSFESFSPALNLVASGEIVIDYLYLPIFGLTAVAKAPMSRLSTPNAIRSELPVYPMKARPFPGFRRLRYAPWT
jgi:hypothetical protein